MKIAISSDHGGNNLRKEIMSLLDEMSISYEDFGPQTNDSVDYPDYARPVAERVAAGEFDRGILICGTGIGISIAANKVKGIRCALCFNVKMAEMAKKHENPNILAIGADYLTKEEAFDIVKAWLKNSFEGDRHQRRIDKIKTYEEK